MSAINPLTQEQLMNYPVLYQTDPHEDASEKYSLISSIDVINELKSYNWYPTAVQTASVKDESRENKQVHCVRLRHFSDLIMPQDNAVEILFFNSFDRTKAFTISLGVYRFSCANGLVIGETFESFKIRHIGDLESNLSDIVQKVAEYKPKLEQKIRDFSSLTLNKQERETFAKLSIPLRYEPHLEINHEDLLVTHRESDRKDTSLYTVMNILQENLLKPNNISGINKETGRKFGSREITSISKDYAINTGIWNLAERIYAIKSPSYIQAA